MWSLDGTSEKGGSLYAEVMRAGPLLRGTAEPRGQNGLERDNGHCRGAQSFAGAEAGPPQASLEVGTFWGSTGPCLASGTQASRPRMG